MKRIYTLIAMLCIYLAQAGTTVKAQVSVSFNCNDTTSCSPACVRFQNTTPGTVSCTWNFGDPGSGTNDTASGSAGWHCFLTAGTYTVTLTVHTGSGTGSGTMVITLLPVPEATFTAVNIGGNTWKFTSTSTGSVTGLVWVFGDPANSSSNVSPAIFTYPTSGAYNAMLLVQNSSGCQDTAVISTVMGIQEKNLENTIRCFPNPSSDGIYSLEQEAGLKLCKLVVYDITGKLVASQQTTGKSTRLDLSAQPSGLYFLQMETEDQVFSRKLFKK
ncbi:MAG: PKD domain-containing protein [Bacteroidia bacterium]